MSKPEPQARELPERRKVLASGRVQLWFDLGAGKLRSCSVAPLMLTPDSIERIGAQLAREGELPEPPRVYGEGGKAWSAGA